MAPGQPMVLRTRDQPLRRCIHHLQPVVAAEDHLPLLPSTLHQPRGAMHHRHVETQPDGSGSPLLKTMKKNLSIVDILPYTAFFTNTGEHQGGPGILMRLFLYLGRESRLTLLFICQQCLESRSCRECHECQICHKCHKCRKYLKCRG